MLEVKLLGQFDARLDGNPVEIASRPAQSLLAYLMLNAGTAHRREKLAGLLWPDTAEANARRNLRQALWRLRQAIGRSQPAGRDYLIADDITIAFDTASEYRLDTAVSVYGGDLLPGFYDE